MASSKEVYLVLGGDIFVGRHVVEQLNARGDTVFVFDATQRHDDVEYYAGDICVPEQISNAIQKSGATCVVHAISPLSIRNRDNLSIFHRVNVDGTRNVIEAAKAAGVGKLIYHSSSGVVFDGRDIINGDENLPYAKKPFDPYTASRALAEQLVLAANGNDGLKTVCIRPTGIFGPGDQEIIVGAYNSWKFGTTHVQLGTNNNICDRTYVGNIAHAILLASDKLSDPTSAASVAGQAFYITNNDPRRFWDFMRSLWAGFDAAFPDRIQTAPKKKTVVIPRGLAMLMAYAMQFLAWIRGNKDNTFTPYTVTFATASFSFSSAKAQRVLGYAPLVSVDEGISRTIAWFKAESEAGHFN
ncbi:3-beta hydroxysteroid dehydrogenase/isomerase family-domain-containing protein [Mycena crocata]|nr:3-beta hydroxysteroid dehydrogenase/isomerase family-domain-containing protein [Mycena crocata]